MKKNLKLFILSAMMVLKFASLQVIYSMEENSLSHQPQPASPNIFQMGMQMNEDLLHTPHQNMNLYLNNLKNMNSDEKIKIYDYVSNMNVNDINNINDVEDQSILFDIKFEQIQQDFMRLRQSNSCYFIRFAGSLFPPAGLLVCAIYNLCPTETCVEYDRIHAEFQEVLAATRDTHQRELRETIIKTELFPCSCCIRDYPRTN